MRMPSKTTDAIVLFMLVSVFSGIAFAVAEGLAHAHWFQPMSHWFTH